LIKPLAFPVDLKIFGETRKARTVVNVRTRPDSSESWWDKDGTLGRPPSPAEKALPDLPEGGKAENRPELVTHDLCVALERTIELV
jgi:hypothetical protein